MILKSSTRGNGAQFARYLMDNSKNEQTRLVEIRGTASPDNIYDSLAELSAYEQLTRSGKGIWQVVISPAPGRDAEMSDADWKLCMDEIERQQPGFEKQPRGCVEHVYEGRKHAHAWWGRYDPETETMLTVDHSALNLRTARESIERQLNHEHLQSWRERKAEQERGALERGFLENNADIDREQEIDRLADEIERKRRLTAESARSLER